MPVPILAQAFTGFVLVGVAGWLRFVAIWARTTCTIFCLVWTWAAAAGEVRSAVEWNLDLVMPHKRSYFATAGVLTRAQFRRRDSDRWYANLATATSGTSVSKDRDIRMPELAVGEKQNSLQMCRPRAFRNFSWADAFEEEEVDGTGTQGVIQVKLDTVTETLQVAASSLTLATKGLSEAISNLADHSKLVAQCPDELSKAVDSLQVVASAQSPSMEMIGTTISSLASRCQVLEHWLFLSIASISCTLHRNLYVAQSEPTPQFQWNPNATTCVAPTAVVAGSEAAGHHKH